MGLYAVSRSGLQGESFASKWVAQLHGYILETRPAIATSVCFLMVLMSDGPVGSVDILVSMVCVTEVTDVVVMVLGRWRVMLSGTVGLCALEIQTTTDQPLMASHGIAVFTAKGLSSSVHTDSSTKESTIGGTKACQVTDALQSGGKGNVCFAASQEVSTFKSLYG